jgi:methanogenic corrinoid protein MtbC1
VDEVADLMTYDIPMLNVSAVVEQTGVEAHSLRAWERRYGIPKPKRSDGGHRLYSQRDVDIIRWLAARQAEGLNIGRAAELWKQLIAAGHDPLARADDFEPPAVVAGASVDALRQAWVSACLAFDEESAEQAVVGGFASLDPESVVTGVLQKGLSQIGDLWYEGQATVQQEHFATELALRRVEALIVASPPPYRSELILVAGPPGELHGFSPLLVTFFLRRRGWNVLHLGADVPLAQLGETVAAQRPSMVISAAQQLSTASTMREMATMLLERGIATAYGGWIFDRIPSLRDHIPGHYLGDRLDCAADKMEALIGAPLPPPKEPMSAERQAALAHFRERVPLIQAELGRFLGDLDMRAEHLAVAMQQLPVHLSAALSLCDLRYMDPCLDWIEGLLANLGFPDDLLRRYLEVYQQAAAQHLDERAELVLSWLDGLVAGAALEVRDGPDVSEMKEKGERRK